MWLYGRCLGFLASIAFILCMVDSRGFAGNVKLVAMNGNQYWFSTSTPYAPTLNFHLAYQYCRTLGLQLAVLETTEEVETISAYLNRESNPMTQGKYWTSGNRLGAESWIWMSSGDQLNSSFADYWLKNGVGAATPENPRHCLAMKPPISASSKRAIFTAEECVKSLPFICEQVRCLYYNYPVMAFPDPSQLRGDIVDREHDSEARNASSNNNGTSFEHEGSESRTTVQYSSSERRQKKDKTLAEIVTEEGRNIIDPAKVQRRMTLRPVMPMFPMPAAMAPFFKPRTLDFTGTGKFSSKRPLFLSKNKEPKPKPKASSKEDSSEIVKPKKFQATGKPFVKKSIEIVTSKSASFSDDGEEYNEDDEEELTREETMFYHRYGNGGSPTHPERQIFGSGYVSTEDPTIIVLDNSVEEEDRDDVAATTMKFFEGSGIRRPDMTTPTTTMIKTKYSGIIADTAPKATTEKMFSGTRLKLRLNKTYV